MFDAYIAAAGVDAPDDERAARDGFVPPTCAELDLDVAGIRSVVWATGYRLDFGWVDLPVLDEWGYPRHVRGVTTHPGLYAAVRRARWSASSRWQTSRERMLRHAGGRQPGARAR